MENLKAQPQAISGDVKDIKKGKTSTDALIPETGTTLTTIETRVEGLSKIADPVAALNPKKGMSIFFSIKPATPKIDAGATT